MVHLLIDDLPQIIVFFLEKISWKSKKQSLLSQSTAESKYRAMINVSCELVWIIDLLTELDFALECPLRLYCDNQAAIHIAQNPVFHEHT